MVAQGDARADWRRGRESLGELRGRDAGGVGDGPVDVGEGLQGVAYNGGRLAGDRWSNSVPCVDLGAEGPPGGAEVSGAVGVGVAVSRRVYDRCGP
ncbi:MAG: hypothetical protein ACRDZY_04815, partial [Acidimicrobiales bacterium]